MIEYALLFLAGVALVRAFVALRICMKQIEVVHQLNLRMIRDREDFGVDDIRAAYAEISFPNVFFNLFVWTRQQAYGDA